MVVTYAPTEGTSDGIISSEILRAKCDARRNNPSTQESRGALLGRPDSLSHLHLTVEGSLLPYI